MKKAGLRVVDTAVAAREADIVMMLVPDEQGGEIYERDVLPGLKAGKYLAFGHGFNSTTTCYYRNLQTFIQDSAIQFWRVFASNRPTL